MTSKANKNRPQYYNKSEEQIYVTFKLNRIKMKCKQSVFRKLVQIIKTNTI